jgi:hypothetical protein
MCDDIDCRTDPVNDQNVDHPKAGRRTRPASTAQPGGSQHSWESHE